MFDEFDLRNLNNLRMIEDILMLLYSTRLSRQFYTFEEEKKLISQDSRFLVDGEQWRNFCDTESIKKKKKDI